MHEITCKEVYVVDTGKAYSSLYNTDGVGAAPHQPIQDDFESAFPGTDGPFKRKRLNEAAAVPERLNGECGPGQREDWMMEPGTGKSMEEILGLGGEGFGKTRTFMDSKSARKMVCIS